MRQRRCTRMRWEDMRKPSNPIALQHRVRDKFSSQAARWAPLISYSIIASCFFGIWTGHLPCAMELHSTNLLSVSDHVWDFWRKAELCRVARFRRLSPPTIGYEPQFSDEALRLFSWMRMLSSNRIWSFRIPISIALLHTGWNSPP